MSTPPAVITRYIQAHKALDLEGMQSCLADNYIFSDVAFPDIDTRLSKGMWAMFLKTTEQSKLKVSYPNPPTGAGLVWEADYVCDYVYNGRPVINHIHGKYTLDAAGEKIVRQEDSFDFHTWSKQSLGLPGTLLGWSGYLRGQVQTRAKAKLETFVDKDEVASKA